MDVSVYNAGSPIDKDGDVLGKMSLSDFRQKAEATKAGDMSSITFGNRLLTGNEADLVMYDGSSEINIAMLPYKHDPATGQLTPDFDYFVKFNEIQRILEENPGISELELANIARDKGIRWEDLNYDRNTNTITIVDTMPFITFSGYVGRDVFNVNKDMKPFLEHMGNKIGRQIIDSYNNMLTYGTTNPQKSSRKTGHFNHVERNDIYKGNIYVPMQNAARAMLLSGIGEYVPKESMTNFAARVTAREVEAAQAQMMRAQDPNYNLIAQTIGKFN